MLEKLKIILKDYTDKADVQIDENTVFIADLGLNSLDLVNLATVVEDEFDIEIPDRAIKEIKTVGDVIKFIEKKSY